MNTIFLIIKSGINTAVYKSDHIVDQFFKPFREKYYLLFYILFSLLYCFISVSSIGIACENSILLSFGNETFKCFNFLQYAIVIILQSFFWKIILGSHMKIDRGQYNVFKLYFEKSDRKLNIIAKMIFFNNSSFRIFISSLVIIPITITYYFDDFIIANIVLAYFSLIAVVTLLNSLETLFYFFEQHLQINSSVFTISLFVIGYVSVSYLATMTESNFVNILVLFFSFIFMRFAINYYIKRNWL